MNRMKLLCLASLALCAICGAFGTHANASTMISFGPASQTAFVGDSLTVDLLLDATGGDAIVGFGMDVQFRPDILAYTGITFNPVFTGPALATTLVPGVISLTALQVFNVSDLTGTDVSLATLSFDAVALGSSSLSVAFPDFAAALDGLFLSPSAGGSVALPDQTELGLVVVQGPQFEVPLPGISGLFTLGFALLAHFSRKHVRCRGR